MCGYRSYDNAMGERPPLKGTEGTEGWLPRCPAFGGPREGLSEPCPGEQEGWVVPGRRKSPKASPRDPTSGRLPREGEEKPVVHGSRVTPPEMGCMFRWLNTDSSQELPLAEHLLRVGP